MPTAPPLPPPQRTSSNWIGVLYRLLPPTKGTPPAALEPEPFQTVPNAVTLLRGITCTVLLGYAIPSGRTGILYTALAIHWSLDFLDGALARILRQETRLGATLDSHTDRLVGCIFLIAMWNLS